MIAGKPYGEVRKQAGIHPENTYVFPLTQYSKRHISGWKAVTDCCSVAELENRITAAGMRHYMATVYAGLEMSESDRESFYAHMGHSASINKNVYQSPLARQAITKIGRFLEGVDTGVHGITTTKEVVTCTNIEEKQDVNNEESHSTVQKKVEKTDSAKTKKTDPDYSPNSENSDDSEENIYFPVEESTSPKKKRTYIPWEKADTRLVQNYFRKYIFPGNSGPLPSVSEIKVFLAQNPAMLKEFPLLDQIVRLRTKIFNERKLSREKLSKSTGQRR